LRDDWQRTELPRFREIVRHQAEPAPEACQQVSPLLEADDAAAGVVRPFEAYMWEFLRSATARIVAMVGLPGSGKTFHLHTVQRALNARAGVSTLAVDCAAPETGDDLHGAIVAALANAGGRRGSLQRARAQLNTAPIVVFCDHVDLLGQPTQAFAQVLAVCTNIRIVYASRWSLDLPGEYRYVPTPLGHAPGESGAGDGVSPALTLFQRDVLGRRTIGWSTQDVAQTDLDEICTLTGGNPAALIRAASYLSPASLQEVVADGHVLLDRLRLDAGLLRSRSAQVAENLDRALDRCLQRFDAGQRDLLAAMAAFTHGCSRAAAVFLAAAAFDGTAADMVAPRALSTLDELHRANLLVTDGPGTDDAERLRIAPLVGTFLRAHDLVTDDMAERRLAYHRDSAVRAARWFVGPPCDDQVDHLRRLLADAADRQEAHVAGLARGSSAAVDLTVALIPYWLLRGALAEGLERIDATLALIGPDDQRLWVVEFGREALLAVCQETLDHWMTMDRYLHAADAAARYMPPFPPKLLLHTLVSRYALHTETVPGWVKDADPETREFAPDVDLSWQRYASWTATLAATRYHLSAVGDVGSGSAVATMCCVEHWMERIPDRLLALNVDFAWRQVFNGTELHDHESVRERIDAIDAHLQILVRWSPLVGADDRALGIALLRARNRIPGFYPYAEGLGAGLRQAALEPCPPVDAMVVAAVLALPPQDEPWLDAALRYIVLEHFQWIARSSPAALPMLHRLALQTPTRGYKAHWR